MDLSALFANATGDKTAANSIVSLRLGAVANFPRGPYFPPGKAANAIISGTKRFIRRHGELKLTFQAVRGDPPSIIAAENASHNIQESTLRLIDLPELPLADWGSESSENGLSGMLGIGYSAEQISALTFPNKDQSACWISWIDGYDGEVLFAWEEPSTPTKTDNKNNNTDDKNETVKLSGSVPPPDGPCGELAQKIAQAWFGFNKVSLTTLSGVVSDSGRNLATRVVSRFRRNAPALPCAVIISKKTARKMLGQPGRDEMWPALFWGKPLVRFSQSHVCVFVRRADDSLAITLGLQLLTEALAALKDTTSDDTMPLADADADPDSDIESVTAELVD